MYQVVAYEQKFNKEIYDQFVEFVREENFFLEVSYEEFCSKLFNNSLFQAEGTFVALKENKVVGFISGLVRPGDVNNANACGFIHTLFVNKNLRRQGIGSSLLLKVEEYFKEQGVGGSRWVFVSNINWAWNIPHYPGHLHPGAPCVRINTEHYFFLLHKGYVINSIHEGFHLPLAEYELPEKVVKKMEENAKEGYTVEVYDPEKHYGIEEFCDAINNPGFAHSIRYNLAKEKPLPFMVAAHNGKVCGWTGAMYNESTGRGHLDGICVDPNERSRGLGRALFCYLCHWSKLNGSSYMTFFTGLDNPARYIYLGAGFKIAQTFADMKKVFK